MKRIRSRVSTTHVDLHGDRMTREALEGAAKQVSEYYIPILWNHDIRYAPLGRTVSAEVVPLEDGEYALETVGEYWEEGDSLESLSGDGRTLRVRTDDYDTFGVRYDRSFRDDDGRAFIGELSALAAAEPQAEEKKALEPVSTLVIAAGAFALGGVAIGFLNRLGSDLYGALKERLKGFFQRNPQRETLVDFEFVLQNEEGRRFEVHVLVDRATAEELEELFANGFDQVDPIVDAICRSVPDAARIVLEWREREIHVRYVVATNGVPLTGDILRRS
jgi:hypothetical protein